MKRTISIKLSTTYEQYQALKALQQTFAQACNEVVLHAIKNRSWNRVELHHMTYYAIRRQIPNLGSQLTCNSIKAVCDAYKALKPSYNHPIPPITFKPTSSVHFDKRTYTMNGNLLSLYTMDGRIAVVMCLGDFQKSYLKKGACREAELVCRKGQWFFNLVLQLASSVSVKKGGGVLGVDIGECNLASTSSGKIFGGGDLCHRRDKYLAIRRRLQSNGSKSAKQLLCKISGVERRHVKHVNHEVSKRIVQEAINSNVSTIAMENLTNIRQNIRAGKRVRSRLHRWAWLDLQNFIEYKAQEVGLQVVYINPAYTSKTCHVCGQLGSRVKHRFSCKNCGSQQHSDLNASRNICRLAKSADLVTGAVSLPNVAT